MTLQITEHEDLLALLDPDRNYGERSYDDVVREVNAGTLMLGVGNSLPRIFDATTKQPVKGTGQPPINDDVQRFSKAKFNAWAADNQDEAQELLLAAMRKLDVRAMKIFFDNQIGPGKEVRTDAVSEALASLINNMGSKDVAIDAPSVTDVTDD